MSTPFGLESEILNPKSHTDIGTKFLRKNEVKFNFRAITRL